MDMTLLLTHILLVPSEENKWKNSNDVRTTKINQVAAVKGNIQQLQLADECQLVEWPAAQNHCHGLTGDSSGATLVTMSLLELTAADEMQWR